jgi:hypothetical protein
MKGLLLCKLKGGLGNQLFQLSYSHRLAEYNNRDLVVDISSYDRDPYSRKEYVSSLFPDIPVVRNTRADATISQDDPIWRKSGAAKFDLSHMSTNSVIATDGYFQHRDMPSEGFIDLTSLRLRQLIDKDNSSKIKSDVPSGAVKSLGIHVRRSDYGHHGVLPSSYYAASIQWFLKRFGRLKIFVVSDEPNYTTHLMKNIGVNIKVTRGTNDLDDFYGLMTCGLHIIANSTFSWWAARLSKSEQVIFPINWSLLESVDTHLFPESWLGVNVPFQKEGYDERLSQEDIEAEKFKADQKKFYSISGPHHNIPRDTMFCPGDATGNSNFDAHYVYHTSWAARRLIKSPTNLHVDIGSDIRFCTIASAFQQILFLDFRPLQIQLQGLQTGRTNLLNLDFTSSSVTSLSCMHVVEHVGLGRYGDAIDPLGSEKAMKELQRILCSEGLLYFVVPVGTSKIVFHAHRIFDPKYILEIFSECSLEEFSLVTDDRRFVEFATLDQASSQKYGCGCFLFRKN